METKRKPLLNAGHIQGAVAGFLIVALLFAGSALLPGARAIMEYGEDGGILFYGSPCYVGRGIVLAGETLSAPPSGGWNAALTDEYALIENIYHPDARRIAWRGDPFNPAP
ncbi:MAG: hypothetical protein FWG72_10965, partial [Oscillospiraceae bacterium]|nr:hypothetical protein [Oscillospiraceae bacterium]